jgi:ketosteroid isomerase-like protein
MTICCERRQLSKMALGTGLCGFVVVLMFASGCNQQAPVDTRAADAQTIKDLDAQWAKTAASHDVDGTVAYYSDDASVMPPNAPAVSDKQAIRAGWAAMMGPGTDVTWQASKVVVASSGDMAYAAGSYTATMKDAQGNPVNDHGKYMEVWKKQADGKWKAVEDIWNSDLPVATPAPVTKKAKK